jgi:molybdenum ABC transporter molybdate-binding protein
VLLNFGASGALLQQMAKGAPADVFASADMETMDQAAKQGLVANGERRNFARNSLVVIVPRDSRLAINRLQDLGQPAVQKVAIGNPASVPVGRYTQHALEAAKLWTGISAKAINTQNVRQSLDYVARGEVDAGFVYGTDAALMKDKVKVAFEVPLDVAISYPIARTAAANNAAEAQKLHRLRAVAGGAGGAGQIRLPEAMNGAWTALALSLKVAGCATLIDLVLGVAVGFLLARRRFPGRELLDTLLTLPMVMPPTVLGYYLLVLIGRHGWLGAWLQDTLRHQPDLHLAGRRDRRRHRHLPARVQAGARRLRGRRRPAGAGGARARHIRGRAVLPRHAAAGLARHPGRRAARLRARAGRIRRDPDGGRQHSRPHPDAVDRRLRGRAGRAGR